MITCKRFNDIIMEINCFDNTIILVAYFIIVKRVSLQNT